MPRPVHVHLLPALFEPADLRGGTAVVIDVLRASTTICHALANGAERVVPCATVDDARRNAAARQGLCEPVLLAGERHCVKVDGFDLGNSPAEFIRDAVAGRTVVMTTTNGTAALLRCAEADEVLVGCFANFKALGDHLLRSTRPVHVVCAGTDGRISSEDVLCAGRIVNRLLVNVSGTLSSEHGDQALIASRFARYCRPSPQASVSYLADSRGGRNLLRLEADADVSLCATLDGAPVLPRFDPRRGEIVAG